MDRKYVRFEDVGIITFPPEVVHSKMGRLESWFGKVVSAGFVSENNHCYGRSESLGIKSLPEDSFVLKTNQAWVDTEIWESKYKDK